jgi:hypothetical protein
MIKHWIDLQKKLCTVWCLKKVGIPMYVIRYIIIPLIQGYWNSMSIKSFKLVVEPSENGYIKLCMQRRIRDGVNIEETVEIKNTLSLNEWELLFYP